jgi:transposase
MQLDAKSLPEDIDVLKKMICEYHSKVSSLEEEVRFWKHKLFGPKSEKLSAAERLQLCLFNEAEQGVAEKEPEEPEEEVAVPAHTRAKKRGRRPLPENLPRVDVVVDIAEEQKLCGCGAQKSVIGTETAERLDIIPAKIQVVREVRPKYACRSCEGVEDEGPTVVIAPPAPHIIPKGIATAGLLAFVITAKFEDALPFYRQCKQFARIGVDISRGTMCAWAIQVAGACGILLEHLRSEMLCGPLLHVDETVVQVLEEPGRGPQTKSYMWLFRGGTPEHPLLEFRYHPTRSGSVAADYLTGYRGSVLTDAFSGYDFLDDRPGIVHAGCWAHARRKFDEVAKASPSGKDSKKPSSAETALAHIRRLYVLERAAKEAGLTGTALAEERRTKAQPILDEFKEWLDARALVTPPKTRLGNALGYTLAQWKRLTVYVDHPEIPLDNNAAENAIRPFVIGRKNWIFAATQDGAHASATLYSLVESAKANGHDPYRYLRHLFDKLPHATEPEDYRVLLPHRLRPTDLPA